MSTCPEKDIHSIYLDNELPAAYVAEYENHVKACPSCQAELNKLKSLHQSFAADCKNITLTPEAMKASFERLQARLSYSKVTEKNVHPFNIFKNSSSYKTIIGFAAAAAVIAVILPVRISNKASQTQAQFQPVARTKLQSPANASVKVDGAIKTTTLSSLFNNNSSKNEVSAASSIMPTNVSATQVSNSNSVYGIPIFNNTSNDIPSSFTSYDVFCPIADNSAEVNSTYAQNAQGVTIQLNSQFGKIYLQIGNVK